MSASTRSRGLDAVEKGSALRLERFKIRTVKLGGVVKEEEKRRQEKLLSTSESLAVDKSNPLIHEPEILV
ncbi:hypothetical protein SLA2020_063060 [Shorea laevis]